MIHGPTTLKATFIKLKSNGPHSVKSAKYVALLLELSSHKHVPFRNAILKQMGLLRLARTALHPSKRQPVIQLLEFICKLLYQLDINHIFFFFLLFCFRGPRNGAHRYADLYGHAKSRAGPGSRKDGGPNLSTPTSKFPGAFSPLPSQVSPPTPWLPGTEPPRNASHRRDLRTSQK